ncbi:DUF2799 domain-containing protein [Arsukibacterium indicum]|uniref:DUF2799 domain-containing protein n=1 Tax=Arsukibacterium indicum TaxID=2848612 RepID=A0ABS6MLU9_9GAMM|nr:DUF2799 domain-containing protein [Arsukibacterium indicum]MBV2129257.1 DUF2799 domain-containing protein [Arsukibacterium indicum]
MRHKLWLSLLAFAALNGCASMDKSQCLTADWRTIGFEDGASGKPETEISRYRQDCADHGVSPDLNAYRLGHRAGSENFCTQRNGFNVGLRGASYQGSCPANLAEQFLSGYQDGQQLYGLQQAVNNARSAIDRQHRQIKNVEKQIAIHTELLVADGLVRDERIRLLNEIEALKAEHYDLINLLPELEWQLQNSEQQLQQGEQQFNAYR